MLIGSTRERQEEELLTWGARVSWGISATVLFLMLMKLLFMQQQVSSDAAIASAKEKRHFSHEEIGKGALSLNAARSMQFIPWLGSELLLLGCNTRPDSTGREPELLLGVKVLGEERVVKTGETIFLSELSKEKEGKRALQFSQAVTELSVKPVTIGKNSVTFEMTRPEEKAQIALSVTKDAFKRQTSLKQKDESPFAQTITHAKHWGKDRLLEARGGEGYRALKEREKVQFIEESGNTYVCFVKAGDFLLWEEGRWRPCTLSEISSSLPVAQVKIASSRSVELEVWDGTGFYHRVQKLDVQPAGKSPGKEPSLFSSIRLRNGSAITCIAGKRRLVLREGDWLLKTSSGWRHLRTAQQIEDCIAHRLMGELFIFEGIEQVQGKSFVKGQLFDTMRTQMQPVSLPISQEKQSAKSKRKRKQ